ncbi:MAG: hypothetical protein QOK29_2143 [Rhodospirillaceae bacterium]|jgi:hypothetical protein|nr:hypothetical protein [Rhodospirillaceae bacterium]
MDSRKSRHSVGLSERLDSVIGYNRLRCDGAVLALIHCILSKGSR